MIRSLLVKFGMLTVTIAVVFWIGWQPVDSSLKHASSPDDSKDVPVRSPVIFEPKPSLHDRSNRGMMAEQSGASSVMSNANVAAPRNAVDLNQATAKELESLPGIGAVLAERVIAYRKSVGRFRTVEDLREVVGIGAKKFDRLKPLVTVVAVETKSKAEKRPL
jgi:competence protein ComEA